MPIYTVTDPISKRTVKLTGDSPPTEAELKEIFAQINRPEKPARAEDFTDRRAPEGSALSRYGAGVAQTTLPTTRLADVVEGPAYAARHPLDALSLLFNAIKDAHVDQAHKTADSARRVVSEPTMRGKLGAASETLGHGAATVLPVIGPNAAHAGETWAAGDLAGMLGQLTGLLAPSGVALASRATTPLRANLGERMATKATAQMEKGLNPTRIDTKVAAAKVAPEMVKRRIWNRDLSSLEQRAAAESTKAGRAVDAAVEPHLSTTTDVLPLVEKLEQAKEPYIGRTTNARKVINQPERVKAIQELQDTLMEYGDHISVESMRKLRQGWDEVVDAARGFAVSDLGTKVKAWAAREGRSSLREALSETVPNIDKVNAEYTFWQRIEDVAAATNERRVGQARNLTSTIAGAGGAVAAEAILPGSGVALGAGKAVLGAKAAAGLKTLLESPGYQMWSAVQKGRLADALMSRKPKVIELTIGRGLRAVSQRPQAHATAPTMAGQPNAESERASR